MKDSKHYLELLQRRWKRRRVTKRIIHPDHHVGIKLLGHPVVFTHDYKRYHGVVIDYDPDSPKKAFYLIMINNQVDPRKAWKQRKDIKFIFNPRKSFEKVNLMRCCGHLRDLEMPFWDQGGICDDSLPISPK